MYQSHHLFLPDGAETEARVGRSEDDRPPDEETSTTACCQMDPTRREAGAETKFECGKIRKKCGAALSLNCLTCGKCPAYLVNSAALECGE